MTVTTKPGRRGEHDISRKTTAQGRPDAPAEPVCSCALFCTVLHTRPRVQRAPGLPCSLLFGGTTRCNLGQIVPREREGASTFRVNVRCHRPAARRRVERASKTETEPAQACLRRRYNLTSRKTSAARAGPASAGRHKPRTQADPHRASTAPRSTPRTARSYPRSSPPGSRPRRGDCAE